MTPLLEVSEVDAGYGQVQALFGVSVTVNEFESVAIIGANGAGKSTLLSAIAGQVKVSAGAINFDGRNLKSVAAHNRVGLGVAMVPEGRRLFPSLSVEENLTIAVSPKRLGDWSVERVVETFPLLKDLLKRSSGNLSGGEQQAVAIGRALMANPTLLLLDEVSLGLAPVVVNQLYEALATIRSEGTTMLLVEQDVGRALASADRVYCMLEGRVSLTGTPESLDQDDIKTAYFGVG